MGSEMCIRDRLETAESADAAVDIATATGFSTTAKDFQSMQSAPVELPGEGLKGAAGGIRCSGLTNPTEC